VLIRCVGVVEPAVPFSSWIVYTFALREHQYIPRRPSRASGCRTKRRGGHVGTDYNCNGGFLGAEVDILQKSDLEHDAGAHANAPFFTNSLFSRRSRSSRSGTMTTQYLVTNLSRLRVHLQHTRFR